MADDQEQQPFDTSAGPQLPFEQRAGGEFDMPPSVDLDMWQTLANPPPSLQQSPSTNPQTAFSDPAYLELQKSGRDILAQQREFTNKSVETIEKLGNDMTSTPIPQLEKQPESPKGDLRQGLMEYMQVATALAALGGAFARGNATVALNAFAGAVKGFTQGKQMEFEQKSEEWKEASQRVKDDNQAKIDQYNLVMANKKMTMDQKLSMIKVIASQYQDEITYNLAERRDYNTLTMFMSREDMMQKKYADSHELMLANLARIQAYTKLLTDFGGQRTMQGRVFIAKVKQYAQQHNGQEPDPDQLQEIANGVTGGLAGARIRGSREGALTAILDTLDVQAPKAISASNNVDRNLSFRTLNELDVAMQAQANNPAAIEFLERNFNIAEGWARSMNPTGVPREDLMNRALKILNEGLSQGTYAHAIDTLVDIVQTERGGLQRKPGAGAEDLGNRPPSASAGVKKPDFKYDENMNLVQ